MRLIGDGENTPGVTSAVKHKLQELKASLHDCKEIQERMIRSENGVADIPWYAQLSIQCSEVQEECIRFIATKDENVKVRQTLD